MKHRSRYLTVLSALCLLLALAFSVTACDKDNGTAQDTSLTDGDTFPDTAAPTEPVTAEKETEPMTEPDTTASVTTEAPTEPVTEPETEKVPDGTLPFVPSHPETIENDWKAMWLSQFDLTQMYCSGGGQRSEKEFRSRIVKVLDNVAADGYNTVVVQVRPYADSMYPSEISPPSRYTTGGYNKDFTYDPFAIIIEVAHEKGLSVHAWINPMRGMTVSEIQQVDAKYTIRQWYDDPALRGDYLVTVSDRLYLNPAHPEVRRLIVDGVSEILANYEVDGIHMDDYFYPTTDVSFDEKAYAAYQAEGGSSALSDWRRENLDKLVSEIYAAVKSHDLRALFGISPAGVIDTVYQKQYADVYNWCANPGYIDYICPQVYFGFEHATCDFVKVCNTWQSIIKTDYVSLIIGMSFGKAVSGYDQWAGSGKNEWAEHKDIMYRSLAHTTTLETCVGINVFCYQHLFDIASGSILPASQEEHEAFSELLKTVTWHEADGGSDNE